MTVMNKIENKDMKLEYAEPKTRLVEFEATAVILQNSPGDGGSEDAGHGDPIFP